MSVLLVVSVVCKSGDAYLCFVFASSVVVENSIPLGFHTRLLAISWVFLVVLAGFGRCGGRIRLIGDTYPYAILSWRNFLLGFFVRRHPLLGGWGLRISGRT